MKDDINPTELARNHWGYILSQLGVDEKHLTGKHTACPACGGEDRFRFDNKEGAGTYYCSGCGAGTGYKLLMAIHGVDFPTALNMVKGVIKPDIPEDAQPKRPSMPEKAASLNRLWKNGEPRAKGTIDYLLSRGLDEETARTAATRLRFTSKAWLRESSDFLPAVLALVMRPGGKPVSIHRTFLMPDGSRVKKLMPGVGDLAGAGIHFGDVMSSSWIVGEGIETTLAAWSLRGNDGNAVSAISANGMEALEVPGYVDDLVIFADNDKSFTGMKAATTLASRVATRKAPCKVWVICPRASGADMLDVVNSDGLTQESVFSIRGGRDE